MKDFLDTATIYYEQDGVEKSWRVGAINPRGENAQRCTPDNEETMRAHLAKWKPSAVFLRLEWEDEILNREAVETAKLAGLKNPKEPVVLVAIAGRAVTTLDLFTQVTILARHKWGNLDDEVHELLCKAEKLIAEINGVEYTRIPGRNGK